MAAPLDPQVRFIEQAVSGDIPIRWEEEEGMDKKGNKKGTFVVAGQRGAQESEADLEAASQKIQSYIKEHRSTILPEQLKSLEETLLAKKQQLSSARSVWSFASSKEKTMKSLSLFVAEEIKKTTEIRKIIDTLSKVLDCEPSYFRNLSQEELLEFKPVVEDLLDAKKNFDDKIVWSKDKNFAKFSRKVFPRLKGKNSLSLFLPNSERGEAPAFQFMKTLHGKEKKKLGEGASKKATFSAKGDVVKGKIKSTVSEADVKEIIKTHEKLQKLEFTFEEAQNLSIPQMVEYTNAQGEKRVLFLDHFMNKRDIDAVDFRIPADQVLPVMKQITKGLKALHDRGLAHRDLGGGNIFLEQREDGSYRAKVADFDGMSPAFIGNVDMRQTDINFLGMHLEMFCSNVQLPPHQRAAFEALINKMRGRNGVRPTIDDVIKDLHDIEEQAFPHK